MPSFNDIDLKDWKNVEVWTDSLWLIPRRDSSGKHEGSYHGNFVPQIPKQLMLRYTKKDETVLDPFVGSGTTAFEAEALERNIIGIDIQECLVEQIRDKIDPRDTFAEFIAGSSMTDSVFDEVRSILGKHSIGTVQLAILHPPYFDIISFSDKKEELSNAESLEVFLMGFSKVVSNTISVLEKGRYLAVVIGDKYSKGQWFPLGFYCMNETMKLGLTLKSIIIKNIEGNRGKRRSESIWRYRALSSDYYLFKHEYILIFKHE